MRSRFVQCLCVMAGLVIAASAAAIAQPACIAPTIVSDKDVPCTVKICYVSIDRDGGLHELGGVKVEPGTTVRTDPPEGNQGFAVGSAGGLVLIPHGGDLKGVKIADGCCVDITFDLWTCTIKITKSAADCK